MYPELCGGRPFLGLALGAHSAVDGRCGAAPSFWGDASDAGGLDRELSARGVRGTRGVCALAHDVLTLPFCRVLLTKGLLEEAVLGGFGRVVVSWVFCF